MVWRILKLRVKLYKWITPAELRRAIEKEWWAIDQAEIDDIILGGKRAPHNAKKQKDCSMKNRIEECIERKGLSTPY